MGDHGPMDQHDWVARALRFVQQEFPVAEAAFLGGSVATGHATRSSDLDLLIILPTPWDEVSFVETSRFEGQLVEAFVYGWDALPTWLERGRAQHRPVLDRLAAEGIPLINGPLSEGLQAQSRVVLDAGPGHADADDLARRAYSLSAHLEDLADRSEASLDTDPAERAVLTWTLWREAAELSLLTQRRWLGTGKWLVRELRADGDPHGLADWAEHPEDVEQLVTVARTVLDAAGGSLQEGFIRGERPPDL